MLSSSFKVRTTFMSVFQSFNTKINKLFNFYWILTGFELGQYSTEIWFNSPNCYQLAKFDRIKLTKYMVVKKSSFILSQSPYCSQYWKAEFRNVEKCRWWNCQKTGLQMWQIEWIEFERDLNYKFFNQNNYSIFENYNCPVRFVRKQPWKGQDCWPWKKITKSETGKVSLHGFKSYWDNCISFPTVYRFVIGTPISISCSWHQFTNPLIFFIEIFICCCFLDWNHPTFSKSWGGIKRHFKASLE